jgi:hypothetical protein
MNSKKGKKSMKKILPLSLIALSSLLYADMSTQEFLYKDPRIMGMGSANTAVGGYSTALFYNPAGLINIKKSHGVEVELLGLSVSGSENTQSFISDLDEADTDQETIDVIKQHAGETYNVTASDYMSVSYHTENDLAFSVGLLGSADINLLPHANSGANGLLETHSRVYGGIMLGAAQKFNDLLGGDITVGLGLKYITQNSYEAGLDEGEVADNSDDLGTYLQDTYEVSNSGFGVDLGILYEPYILESLHPTIGLSVMNMGTLDFEDSYGAQPMTVNMGVSISPELSFVNSLRVAVDYVDITNTQQARVRNYNPYRSQDQYDSVDISYDALQHVRAGVSVGLFDNSWMMMTLNGGLYQGAYTAGADIQLTLLKVQFATYQEQLGAEIGQIEDRRYVVGVGLGW